MPWNEEELKRHLKEAPLLPVYVLYGEESYLTAHYADKIAGKAAGGDTLDAFNLHKFDGQDCSFDQLEEAAEALPLMAERSCVVVRDYDVTARAATQDRLIALLSAPPESCTLIFWMDTVAVEPKKNAKWKAFLAAAEKGGAVVAFSRKTAGDLVRLLVSGATRRGCSLRPETARVLIEQCGDDMHLLLGELDKLCALAGEGQEVTRGHVEQAVARRLEARVFDLSKAILAGQYTRAYEVIDRLFAGREDPVAVLGVLSNAYADLYRMKVAGAGGARAEDVAKVFAYRGREFALRNAARDGARLSVAALRDSLEVLAEADRRLKSTRLSPRTLLEETAARLIVLAKTGQRL